MEYGTEFVTVEIDLNGCGRLQFEVPPDITEEEIAYLRSLMPRAADGLLELVDPVSGEVVFSCRPVMLH